MARLFGTRFVGLLVFALVVVLIQMLALVKLTTQPAATEQPWQLEVQLTDSTTEVQLAVLYTVLY